jgi:hypothetical protein
MIWKFENSIHHQISKLPNLQIDIMFVAQQKLKSNVAEYLLYMWQIENIIRACHFDIKIIQDSVINQMGLSDENKKLEIEWFKELIQKMKNESLLNKGHLSELNDLLTELSFLHTTFIKSIKETEYSSIYKRAQPAINELHQKQNGIVNNEIEVCLNGLFGLWLLKSAKKPVSEETASAMKLISDLIAHLVAKYHEMMGSIQELTNNNA